MTIFKPSITVFKIRFLTDLNKICPITSLFLKKNQFFSYHPLATIGVVARG